MVTADTPEAGMLSLQDWHTELSTAYIIYADLQILAVKTEGLELEQNQSNAQKAQTTRPAVTAMWWSAMTARPKKLWYTEALVLQNTC